MDPDALLTTTRTVRKRLDFERPVPRELILECMELAVQAPTGSNRQDWQFVFVSDPARKRAIGELYGRAWDAYNSQRRPDWGPDDVRTQRMNRVISSAQYLRERMHEAPWLLIPCIQGRLGEGTPTAVQASRWGSILPAFWSFMLAARTRGLGTAWTTLHVVYEREVAEVLGIPHERYTQAGMSPVAFYTEDDFRPAPRIPLESVIHWESW